MELQQYRTTTFMIAAIGICFIISTLPNGEPVPSDKVLQWVDFYPPAFESGAWWQLLSANFFHASLSHLFNNAFGLFVFGQLVEPILGSKRLALLSFFAAITTCLFSWWFVPNPSLGASGIVYAWMVLYMTLTLLVERHQHPDRLWAQIRSVLGLGLLFFLIDNTNPDHKVNSWGHLGGAVAGILYGLWFGTRLLAKLKDAPRPPEPIEPPVT